MTDENNLRYNQFIEKLYTSPSSTPQDKERIVKLLLSEREKGFVTEERIREMIKIELNNNPTKSDKDNNSNENSGGRKDVLDNIKYRPPYYLSDFLEEYNKDYPILKYTCHTIDSNDVIDDICHECGVDCYDFDLHYKIILEHYHSLESKYKFIDNKVKGLIYGYLTGKNIDGKMVKWGTVFYDSWGSESIRDWAHKNPEKVPNPGLTIKTQLKYEGFVLSKQYYSPLTGDPVIGFDDLVMCFKSMFHIKDENSMESILSYVEERILSEFPGREFVRTNFHNELQLFTHVQALQTAYDKILRMCIELGIGKRIETEFYENEKGYKCLTVKDTGSVFKKSVSDTVKRPGDKMLDIIKNQINGMCDFYLVSDFPDGLSYKINLWNENRNRFYTQVEKVNGVKYLLEFKIKK